MSINNSSATAKSATSIQYQSVFFFLGPLITFNKHVWFGETLTVRNSRYVCFQFFVGICWSNFVWGVGQTLDKQNTCNHYKRSQGL